MELPNKKILTTYVSSINTFMCVCLSIYIFTCTINFSINHVLQNAPFFLLQNLPANDSFVFLVFKTWFHSLSRLTSNSQQSSCLTKQVMSVKVLTNMFGQLFVCTRTRECG